MIQRMIVAGGGTGGHLYPGVAVVEELRRRHPALDVLFVGTERGIEAKVVPALGERLELVDVAPLKGQSAARYAGALLKLPRAAWQAARIVRRERPDLVLGVGGYASGPLLAAAAFLGVPTAVLEQNARVGLTNRLIAPLVGRAYVTFPATAVSFPAGRVRACGNPVRRAFVEAARRAVADPDGFEARARTVLVIGGSQGARALNEVVPEALARAASAGRPLRVLHQTGAAMRLQVESRYRALGVDARVLPFIDDMASAYAGAALVIARAGATTVAELCAVGRASILIPYPHAADDHQGKNAETLADAGAAMSIREEALDSERLGSEVARLLAGADSRRAMADAARELGKPEAAAAIVDDLGAWLGGPPPRPATTDASAGASGADGRGGPRGTAASRVALRGHRPFMPRFGNVSGRRRSSVPIHRRPVYSMMEE